MASPEVVKAWLRQARADARAANGAANVPECHRRYFLQQACEKGIKALGLVLWKGEAADFEDFKSFFLHRHDPIQRLGRQPDLPRSLKLLLREIETELASLDNSRLLIRVDATSPSRNPNDVSYRYPFVDAASGALVAPVDWETRDWDAYQGNEMGVRSAVARLLDSVERRNKRDRGPR